jgi:hypothetical protein
MDGWPGWPKAALSRFGGWRSNLCWRVLGWAIFQLWIQNLGRKELGVFLDRYPPEFHFFCFAGLVLCVAGPRTIVLLLTALSGSWFFFELSSGRSALSFLADEYLLQAGAPLLGCIVLGRLLAKKDLRDAAAGKLGREVDRAWIWLFRALVITTMVFATFHKLNADFLDPVLSCANLSDRLEQWWPSPISPVFAALSPTTVVVLEGLAPLLLLLYPRVGVVYTALFISGMGHIGPTAFALTIIALSLAGFESGDGAIFRRLVPRLALPFGALVVAGLAVSYFVFAGPSTWIRFALFQVVALSTIFWGSALLVARARQLRGRSPDAVRRALVPHPLRRSAPWRNPVPGLASWIVLALVVNGLTPYLGVKYRFSTAMLSNLRVDEDRWNHLVMPQWVYLRDHDPYVHVDVVDPLPRKRKERKEVPRLSPGLHSPDEFRRRLDESRRRGHRARVQLRYRGEALEYADIATDLGVRKFAETLPHARMFQAYLDGGPQGCTH